MLKLLNEIRALFKLSHTQCVPKANSSAVIIEIASGENYLFTCPSDGYVCAYYRKAYGTAEKPGAIFLGNHQNRSTTACKSISTYAHDGWLGAWVRVRKGDICNIWVSYDGADEGQTWFVPDEGV